MKGKFDPCVLWPLACDLWPLNRRTVYCSRLYGNFVIRVVLIRRNANRIWKIIKHSPFHVLANCVGQKTTGFDFLWNRNKFFTYNFLFKLGWDWKFTKLLWKWRDIKIQIVLCNFITVLSCIWKSKVRFSWLFALASRGKLISINSVDSPISRLITADHY